MFELERVAHGVFVGTHPFCFTTTTVVLGEEDGFLVVDPGVTDAAIHAVAASIAGMGRRIDVGSGIISCDKTPSTGPRSVNG